ncbi:hypothetical protein FRC17_003700 [Serendipita sp. 399]|nr:hypothetical protein FRC17_003700 [Serendipita sp. 399]
MEEDRTVIFGREMEPGPGDDVTQEVIVAFLEQLPKTNPVWPVNEDWKYYWDIILVMELDSGGQAIRNAISDIQNSIELELLVSVSGITGFDLIQWMVTIGQIVVINTLVTCPPLAIANEEAMRRLKKNQWDWSALTNVMKDVDPRIQRIFKACAIAWFTTSFFYPIIRTLLRNLMGGGIWDDDTLRIIFRRWDYELWRPLPHDVEWRRGRNNGEWCACRMKRFRAKPEYKAYGMSSEWVRLKVDENGDVLDTHGNQEPKKWIQEEPIKEPKSLLSKFLQKLNV